MEFSVLQQGDPAGQTVLFIAPPGGIEKFGVRGSLSAQQRVLAAELEVGADADEAFGQLCGAMEQAAVRRATVVGAGSAGIAIFRWCCSNLKEIRRVVLIDVATRRRPSKCQAVLERIGNLLPAGLPGRHSGGSPDIRSDLHRLRCPVLLLVSRDAEAFIKKDNVLMHQHIPNSWLKEIIAGAWGAEVEQFLDVAAKQPRRTA